MYAQYEWCMHCSFWLPRCAQNRIRLRVDRSTGAAALRHPLIVVRARAPAVVRCGFLSIRARVRKTS